MSRGQRDFGIYASKSITANLSDMGELAVRLGSPVIFDRRGDVILLDDFEGTVLKWTPITIGNGAVTLDSTMPYSGSQCLKLTSGNGMNEHATVGKGLTPLLSKRLGIEFIFTSPSKDAYLELGIGYFDGVTKHLAFIRFDFNTQKIAYKTGTFNWTDIIDTVAFFTSNFFYYPIKLVVDFSTGYFVRVIFSGVEYDLSEYQINSKADTTNPNLLYKIAHLWRANSGSNIYIDDVIFTQDEP